MSVRRNDATGDNFVAAVDLGSSPIRVTCPRGHDYTNDGVMIGGVWSCSKCHDLSPALTYEYGRGIAIAIRVSQYLRHQREPADKAAAELIESLYDSRDLHLALGVYDCSLARSQRNNASAKA